MDGHLLFSMSINKPEKGRNRRRNLTNWFFCQLNKLKVKNIRLAARVFFMLSSSLTISRVFGSQYPNTEIRLVFLKSYPLIRNSRETDGTKNVPKWYKCRLGPQFSRNPFSETHDYTVQSLP